MSEIFSVRWVVRAFFDAAVTMVHQADFRNASELREWFRTGEGNSVRVGATFPGGFIDSLEFGWNGEWFSYARKKAEEKSHPQERGGCS